MTAFDVLLVGGALFYRRKGGYCCLFYSGQILIRFHFHCVSYRSGSAKTVSNVIIDQQISDDDDDQFVVEAALPLPEMPDLEMVCSCCKL